MAVTRNLDVPILHREDLLDDYLVRANGDYGALAATALRTRSLGLRDVLLHGALRSGIRSEELKSELLEGKVLVAEDITDLTALAELGRVILLQNLMPGDLYFGEQLLSTACEYDQNTIIPARCRRVLVQYYIVEEKYEHALRLLDAWPDIDKQDFHFLRAELYNPFLKGSLGDKDIWLESFNRPFLHYGLAPVTLSNDASRLPFDRLTTLEQLPNIDVHGPLVSVVLTAYQPNEERLLTSVRSVLEQTWQNLELIVVDDCSGPDYKLIFERLRSLDPRITVIHASVNRGTYVARNIGYSSSKGELITGQDDDDWSHPERIERQVHYLQNDKRAIGCRVQAVRCDNNLQRVRIGYSPKGQNASSLMIRREAYEKAGNFLPARKAADTEYHLRVERITGRPVATLREPLSIIRILSDSLSRGDFDPAWKHKSRISFRSAYEYWHRTSELEELFVAENSPNKVKIPSRFQLEPQVANRFHLDVVIAANWEDSGDHLDILLKEVRALLASDLRVGIINLESPLKIRSHIQSSLDDDIQYLINSGDVEEVFLDDEIKIQLLLVRHVPTLQFLTYSPSSLTVNSIIIGADIAPVSRDGTETVYLPNECATNAMNTFGVEPWWIPWSAEVREPLESYLDSERLIASDMPKVIVSSGQTPARLWYRSAIPVIGYYTSTNGNRRPLADDAFKGDWLATRHFDVRGWGEQNASQHDSVGDTGDLLYTAKEISFSNFLKSVDYFIFFPDSSVQHLKFHDLVSQALTAGVLVILPSKYKSTYGDAAIYTRPENVQQVIANLHSSFEVYRSNLSRMTQVLQKEFSYEAFTGFITPFLME